MVRGGARRCGSSTLALLVLSFWLVSTPRAASADKCCECGTTFQDSDTTTVCFTDPNNANDCDTACGQCSLVRSEYNANTGCAAGAPAPRCAGRTYANSGSAGVNCPEAPPACESGADCGDNNACTTDSCVGGTCVNDPITCPGSSTFCTVSTCSTTTGCGFTNNNGAVCSDGNVCTENDVCSAGSCVGSPVAACVPPPVAQAPVTSNLGLGALTLALFVLAVVVLRRRGVGA